MISNFSFENLQVYQEARKLVKVIYSVSESFPPVERFGLSSQIQRAVVSIVSNIAEGAGRKSYKEKVPFLEIAYGSLMEVYCQLQLAADLNYIDEDYFNDIKKSIFNISRLLGGLNASFSSHTE